MSGRNGRRKNVLPPIFNWFPRHSLLNYSLQYHVRCWRECLRCRSTSTLSYQRVGFVWLFPNKCSQEEIDIYFEGPCCQICDWTNNRGNLFARIGRFCVFHETSIFRRHTNSVCRKFFLFVHSFVIYHFVVLF